MLVVAASEPDGAGDSALAAVAPVRSPLDAGSAPDEADTVVGTTKRASSPEGHVIVRPPPPPAATSLPLAVTSPRRPRHRLAFALTLAAVFGLGMAVAHVWSTDSSASPGITSAPPRPGSAESPVSEVVPTAPAGSSIGGTGTGTESQAAATGDDSGGAATTEDTVVIDPASDPAATTPTDQAPILTAAPRVTLAPGVSRTLALTGQMVFPYLGAFINKEYHVAGTLTVTGACDGRQPCSLTSLFPGTPYEGQPATFALTPAADGYTLSARFDHIEPGSQCAPISVRLELSVLAVDGPDGPGLIGSGQYVPDRRSTALPDGSLGCTTDVGVFSFASQGLVPPPRPTPAPAPPLT